MDTVCTVYTIQCGLYSVDCILFSVYCTMYIVQHTDIADNSKIIAIFCKSLNTWFNWQKKRVKR